MPVLIEYFGLPIFSTLLTIFVSFHLYHAWNEKADIRDEITRIKAIWTYKQKLAWFFIGVSIANALDFGSRFPFPVVGMTSEYISLLLILVGIVMLYTSNRPKVNEILAMAQLTHGYLTQVAIMTKLGFSELLVRKTLRYMIDNGYLLILNPSDKKQLLPDIIFLVRTYSGEIHETAEPAPATEAQAQTVATPAAGDEHDNRIRRANSHVVRMGVDEVTRRLLNNTLRVGAQGRPA